MKGKGGAGSEQGGDKNRGNDKGAQEDKESGKEFNFYFTGPLILLLVNMPCNLTTCQVKCHLICMKKYFPSIVKYCLIKRVKTTSIVLR